MTTMDCSQQHHSSSGYADKKALERRSFPRALRNHDDFGARAAPSNQMRSPGLNYVFPGQLSGLLTPTKDIG